MPVSIRKPSERVEKAAIVRAWGIVAEKVAADTEIRDAVLLVLGYEQDRVSTDPVFGIPADQSHAIACVAFGKRGGLDRAALALLDRDYIAESREAIEEANKETES